MTFEQAERRLIKFGFVMGKRIRYNKGYFETHVEYESLSNIKKKWIKIFLLVKF